MNGTRSSLVARRGAATILISALALTASAAPGGAAGTMLFTPEAYMDHLRFLASDELEGRDTGAPGNDRAAEYIADHFREYGLEPGGVDGTYFQPFDVRDGSELVEANAKLAIDGVKRDWKLGTDWTPMPFSGEEVADGPLAFAGYGISAPDLGYDDLADFDAEGKVLLVLRGEPKSDDPKAAIGGTETSRHALFVTKARVAHRKGALGLLIVNTRPEKDEKDELYEFDEGAGQRSYDVPIAHITRESAAALLAAAGMPGLDELQAGIEKDRKPATRDLPKLTVHLNPGLEPKVLKARNVIGILPGEGAADEYLVIGAHYDHVGVRSRSFQRRDGKPMIHNGADDNASGTCGLLELARVLSTGPRPRRSLLFIAFSGEERGLFGSKHFVKEPTVALDKVRAMTNFDMIGRLSLDRFTVYGTQTAKEFADIVDRAASDVGLKFKAARDLPGNSDHAPFHRKKIPVLFPFTGLHKQYHQPEDDWERIDAAGAARVLQFAYECIREIADMKDGPTPTDADIPQGDIGGDTTPGDKPGTPDVSTLAHPTPADDADKSAGDQAADAGDEAAPRMPRVRLGIMPAYGDTGEAGLGIDGLVEGGAAEKAGFKDDDRIIKVGDREVKDIYSYMDAMADVKPGETVEFTLKRGDQNVVVKVTFPATGERKPSDG